MIYRGDRRQPYRPRNPEAGLAVVRLAITAVAVALAWWRGWPSRRLSLIAACCCLLAAEWVEAARVWLACLVAEGLAGARHRFWMATGTGLYHPGSPARFSGRLWAGPLADGRSIRTETATYFRQDGVIYLHMKPPAYAPTPEPPSAGIRALPSGEPPARPRVSGRGPAPVLPLAATPSLPPAFPDSEPLPRIEPAAGSLPQLPPVPAPPRPMTAADAPMTFLQALGPARNDPQAE
jgi:hypothetical protein